MKLFAWKRKPRWQHRDPAKRAQAIAGLTGSELGSVLPELARGDPEPEVRREAIRRLDEPSLLADRASNDADESVRATARRRLLSVLCAPTGQVAFAGRERVVRILEDQELLAEIASNADEAELRRTALEHIARPGFLVERCLKDSDPALRRWLLERIDSLPALERIAEASRRSDKQLARLARERLETMRLASRDPAAVAARGVAIAEQLGALQRNLPADAEAQAQRLRTEWHGRREHLDAPLNARIEALFDRLASMLAPAPEPAAPPEAAGGDSVDAVAETTAVEEPLSEAELSLSAPATPAAEPTEEAAAERPAPPARRAPPDDWVAELAQLETELEGGALAAARTLHAQLAAAIEQFVPPRALQTRWSKALAQLDRLQRWQHWAAHQQRRRVFHDLEALSGSGLHPDAVASRVRELQGEWQQLQQRDGAAPEHQERRFRGLCHRVLAPAQAYFERRDELRSERESALSAELDEIALQLQQPEDAVALIALRRQLTDRLRRLDELPPRQRGPFGRRLRQLLDRAGQGLDELRARIEEDKHKLIAQTRRLLARADAAEAIDLAQQAQQRWKSLPRAAREVEAKLWDEFRAVLDPVYDRQRQAHSLQHEQEAARHASMQAVLDELAALADGDAQQLVHADARLAALSERWRTLSAPAPAPEPTRSRSGDRRPERAPRAGRRNEDPRFEQLAERVRRAAAAAGAQRDARQVQAMQQAAAICAEAEHAALTGAAFEIDAQRAALPSLPDSPVARRLRERFDRAADWLQSGVIPQIDAELQHNRAAAADLAVDAELGAGIDSPVDAQPRRRELQMRRLAERLSGAAMPQASAEAARLREAWLSIGPLADADRRELGARIEAALRALDSRA